MLFWVTSISILLIDFYLWFTIQYLVFIAHYYKFKSTIVALVNRFFWLQSLLSFFILQCEIAHIWHFSITVSHFIPFFRLLPKLSISSNFISIPLALGFLPPKVKKCNRAFSLRFLQQEKQLKAVAIIYVMGYVTT